ncbi:hypothetical protein F4808DRAFT_437323 [Astrocystis sublimbata]|nr:hypothetical protein F4808DRAFT_437323 [Astrocystis sublimbata]
MAQNGYLNSLLGFMPRRRIFLPALCIVLLIAVWTFRLPDPRDYPYRRPLDWLEAKKAGLSSSASDASEQPAAEPLPDSKSPSKSPSKASSSSHSDSKPKGGSSKKQQFASYQEYLPTFPDSDVDLSQPDAPFVSWPLRRLCDETEWVDGLVFLCDNNSGGIGNIRNYIQTCIRYAIESGATGLTIPKIRQRNEENLSDLFTDFLPFDYMFDEQHFRDAFAESCPQITLYDNITDIPELPEKEKDKPKISNITPKDFGNRESCDPWDQNRHTDRFGQTFRKWLHKEKFGHYPTLDHPRLIRFNWGVLFDWQIYRDGPELACTFGGILKLNDKFIELGKRTLAKMHKFARDDGAKDGAFLGIHLRTESDALGFWPKYETQTEAYMKFAKEKGYQTAYLATGNQTEAEKLMDGAVEMAQMRIVTKMDLLSDDELDEIDALTWDQQGLIDYVVLLGSEFFIGVQPSSFSVHVAMKRHLKTGGVWTRPYKVGTQGDGLSYIVGNYNKYWSNWLFLWDGMWP